jgi:hypothetical protein
LAEHSEEIRALTHQAAVKFVRSRWTSGGWQLAFRILEIALIALWAGYVGRDLLEAGHYQLNLGGDNVSAYGRFFWDHVRSCGSCALWSGEVNGGTPASIDPNADTFHPVVAIPALIAGTLQGIKLTIVICLFMGGLACWWLALELGAGPISRLAAGIFGVAAGYLSGRSYQGLVVVLTSVAAAALVVPAVLRLRRLPTRRSAGILGCVLGLFVLAGQGYLQIGVVLLSPLFFLLLIDAPTSWRVYAVRMAQAVATGVLICSVFLVGFLRYYGDFAKEQDIGFQSHQTMRYLVLNLVIDDWNFFQIDKMLGKQSLPGLYINYVGWVVVLFAVVGSFVLWQRSKPLLLTLALFIAGSLWIGSGAPFHILARPWAIGPIHDFAVSIRNPSFIATAAVPPIIGLAALGIQQGLEFTACISDSAISRLSTKPGTTFVTWMVQGSTIVLLVLGIRNVYASSQQWLIVEQVPQERVDSFLDFMETDDLAWVSPPSSDWKLQMLGFDAGLKFSDGWRPWSIGSLQQPPPFKAVRFEGDTALADMSLVESNDVGFFYESSEPNHYVVSDSGGTFSAHGEAGKIEVTCDLPTAGTVMVHENAFAGWQATVGGNPLPLIDGGQWISFALPEGPSTVELRFRPWDFWVGLALSIAGGIFAAVLILLPERVRFRFHWRNSSFSAFSREQHGPEPDLLGKSTSGHV